MKKSGFEGYLKSRKLLVAVFVAAIAVLLILLAPRGVVKLFLFLLFAAVSAVISYVQASVRSPVDLSPTFFLAIIISVDYGLIYSILFIPISSIIPAMMARGEVGLSSFLFMLSFIFLGFASKFFISFGIVNVGIAAALANLAVGWFVVGIHDNRSHFVFSVANAAVSIFYFVVLGNFLFSALS